MEVTDPRVIAFANALANGGLWVSFNLDLNNPTLKITNRTTGELILEERVDHWKNGNEAWWNVKGP